MKKGMLFLSFDFNLKAPFFARFRLRSRGSILSLICTLAIGIELICPAQEQQDNYRLKVHTDEVSLFFHATDADGHVISDLKEDDLDILDNGRPIARITEFKHYERLPLRVAIVFDTTPSMGSIVLPSDLANIIAKTAIHDSHDQALVAFFDFEPVLQQNWTNDASLLVEAASRAYSATQSRFGGSAIWDSLYRVCRDYIPEQEPGHESFASAMIVLTDGNDNRSHALPQDVVDKCQSRGTAIYTFFAQRQSRSWRTSKEVRAFTQLLELTGGRAFSVQEESQLAPSIREIENDLRDHYTVLYRPDTLKRDGRFHPVEIKAKDRNIIFSARKGYYAHP